MIRFIAAIDTFRGLADNDGIPWDLPSDYQYYTKKVSRGRILMGYGTYLAHSQTLHGHTEYVATSHLQPLREGFKRVEDIDTFLNSKSLTWVLGGSQLFESLLDRADELYITQVNGNFHCTKFFPAFEEKFTLVRKSAIHKENGTEFQYQVWKNKRNLLTTDLQQS